MRYIVSGIVFCLIAIVPFGSWYYLQSGLNYRKEALKELEPKMKFEVEGFDDSLLKSKTTLLQVSNINNEILPEVYDQYSKSETYQVYSLQTPGEDSEDWFSLSGDLAKKISLQFDNSSLILVDTSGIVRNSYSSDPKEIAKMIEHTSIILPRIKEIDIKMRK